MLLLLIRRRRIDNDHSMSATCFRLIAACQTLVTHETNLRGGRRQNVLGLVELAVPICR
jgi:hypothetical protein